MEHGAWSMAWDKVFMVHGAWRMQDTACSRAMQIETLYLAHRLQLAYMKPSIGRVQEYFWFVCCPELASSGIMAFLT